MSRPIPSYLKLRSPETGDPLRPDIADIACLGELCQAFTQATGWPLRYVPQLESHDDIDLLWSAPINPGVGVSPGHLRIDLTSGVCDAGQPRCEWHSAEQMAGTIAELVNELVCARQALWQREADLAAAVPVTSHANEEQHLAARLEATLCAGASAIGCQSAALYLLDEATSELKLRSCWGMPLGKFTLPARPLAEQMADLEALLGHAVALESPLDMLGSWRPPEPAEAALCVPVSSPTVPLGTLWLFCERERPFTDEQTNLAEVVAGKIAADLERTALLQQQSANVDLEKQVSAVRRTQEHQLPVTGPPLAGWSIGGWAEQRGPLGGAFYDWRMIDESSLLIMLGDACDHGVEAALTAAALRGALRAEEYNPVAFHRLIARANRVLWETGCGTQWAGLWLGQLSLENGHIDFVSAGRPTAISLRADGWNSLSKPCQPLGLEPSCAWERKQLLVKPGESLFVCNRGMIETSNDVGRAIDEAALAQSLRGELNAPPERMIEMVRELVEAHARKPAQWDRSVLVLKRLPPR